MKTMDDYYPAYHFRTITTRDEKILQDMLYLAIYLPPGESLLAADIVNIPDLKKYYAGWGKPHDFGLIAIEANSLEPLGAAWMRCFSIEHPGYGFVNVNIPEITIAVERSHRNQGIGTALLKQLISVAENSYLSLSLNVDQRNPAIHLYERLGFRIYSKIDPSVTMILMLNSRTMDSVTNDPIINPDEVMFTN
jgi:ribosomal protein S18 acetylase RimI-like enzyme